MKKKNDLPVGESETESSTAQDAVEQAKGRMRRPVTREDHARTAMQVLTEVRTKMAEGYTYETEQGTPLETPEQVLQLALAKKSYNPIPPKEKKS